ncbi:MAG: hypothetical protein Q4615_18805 [Paracoccus aminovorans]|nr:hypothetical protein [Paracoccus aminovorans]
MSVGLAEMRALAQRLFAAAVSAADPALAVRRHFQRHPDTGGTILVAVGKAAPACSMVTPGNPSTSSCR